MILCIKMMMCCLHTMSGIDVYHAFVQVMFDVRGDMERYFLHAVPEDAPYFKHVVEGPDDMPAHIKASLLGSSLSVPVANGRLLLGMWQGIWLGEHRIEGGSRTVVISIF